ncbi:MAG TPA: hypothetical protein VKB19_02385 [Pedobacter sp.]|nr:hypothetical protein [Pedobacter sp.]
MLKMNCSRGLVMALLLLLVTIYSGCAVHYTVAVNKFAYQDDIAIELQKVQSSDGQSTWGNMALVPPRKHTFVRLTLQLSNTGVSSQVVDLTKIVLFNAENKTKYPVVKIYQVAPVPIGARDDLKLNAGEQVKRVLMFTYPQKLRPELLEINGKIVQITYQ